MGKLIHFPRSGVSAGSNRRAFDCSANSELNQITLNNQVIEEGPEPRLQADMYQSVLEGSVEEARAGDFDRAKFSKVKGGVSFCHALAKSYILKAVEALKSEQDFEERTKELAFNLSACESADESSGMDNSLREALIWILEDTASVLDGSLAARDSYTHGDAGLVGDSELQQ